MRKYEHVDVIASLGAVMEINTEHYKSDFQYDREMFQKAAQHPDAENTRLLWLSRSSGTECFYERDAYLNESYAHHSWLYHTESRDGILAYAVEITGMEGGRVMGNLYELDAQQHAAKVERDSLPAAFVTLKFEDGAWGRYPYEEYDKRKYGLIDLHGKILDKRLEPQDEDVLQARLHEARREREKYRPAVFKVGVHSRKPSIRRELAAGKAKAAPKKAAAKTKNNELEVG